MAVCLSGAVASALTYDQISAGDQVGLLLGKVVIDVKDTVSDSQISGTKVDTSVHIFSHVPCPHSLRFYDRTGKVVDANLKTLIKERQKEIVGWYRFRRHSSLRVSLRETAVHRSLLQTLGIPQTEHFVFLLTTASATTNLATHSYDHVIYKLTSANEFASMSLSVINLGDTTHSQYKHHSAIVTPTGAGQYQSVVKKFENQFHDDTGGIREISRIQELAANLISHLEKISLLVLDEEKQLEELEEEVEKYEQVATQLKKPKSGLSPSSQINVQNSGPQDEETNTNKEIGNRESLATDKERLITDFLNNSESEHKIQLEVHLTKSQQGNNPNGLFGGDNYISSSSSSSLMTQPAQNSGESLLHQLPNDQEVRTVPLKPKTIPASKNNPASTDNKKIAVLRGDGPHTSAMTATTVKSVGEGGPKRPGSSSDHFSFVEHVLKEAKETPDMINGEDSLRLDNCVTVPMGAQLQSPPGVANMCSQMSAKNNLSLRNDSLPDSTGSNANAVPTTPTIGGTRRRTRSRSDQQQQQTGSVTVAKPSTMTRSYSPISARNASPSPTPTTVPSSSTDSGSSPRHTRTRTPQSKGLATTTATSSRESRIDSNRSSTSSTSSKVDSLNKEVHKSPVRRCRPTRPKERTLSSSNSPSRRETNSIDYSTVRSVSPFF